MSLAPSFAFRKKKLRILPSERAYSLLLLASLSVWVCKLMRLYCRQSSFREVSVYIYMCIRIYIHSIWGIWWIGNVSVANGPSSSLLWEPIPAQVPITSHSRGIPAPGFQAPPGPSLGSPAQRCSPSYR